MEKRENNLNAVRLLLALLVLYSHSYLAAWGLSRGFGLGADAGQKPKFQYYAGFVAVDLFFFVSGLLITASWLRSKSMNDYLRKRVLRIYPGFIAASLVTIIIMTAANPSGLLRSEVSLHRVKSFLSDCLWLSNGNLFGPAVFPSNPNPYDANGPMWTIPHEFECYLAVCVIGLFCLFKFRWLMLAAFIFTYLLVCRNVLMGHVGQDLAVRERRFFLYFLAGMCAWLWRDKIPLSGPIALMLLALISLVAFAGGPWLCVEPFALTYLVLWLGYAKPLGITRWCDSTDLSYGVYLYAFPVQQLIAIQAWGRHPWVIFLMATPITALLAFASWHVVEKQFLNLKSSRYSDRDTAASPTDDQLKEAF